MNPLTRQQVYSLIDGERDYQDALIKENGWIDPKRVGEYLTILRAYLRKAEDAYIKESDSGPVAERPSLDNIRKIAGIAVACMEQNGAPARLSELAVETEAKAPIGELMHFKVD
jgi:hypothetical protein